MSRYFVVINSGGYVKWFRKRYVARFNPLLARKNNGLALRYGCHKFTFSFIKVIISSNVNLISPVNCFACNRSRLPKRVGTNWTAITILNGN